MYIYILILNVHCYIISVNEINIPIKVNFSTKIVCCIILRNPITIPFHVKFITNQQIENFLKKVKKIVFKKILIRLFISFCNFDFLIAIEYFIKILIHTF